MNTLKDLRVRISSVKSTQKITSAMKMVATAKLRKAQERLDYGRFYRDQYESAVRHALRSVLDLDTQSLLLTGAQGAEKATDVLIIAIGTDRGLCGGYNATITREVKHCVRQIHKIQPTAKVHLLPFGRKIKSSLSRDVDDGSVVAQMYMGKTYNAATQSFAALLDQREIDVLVKEIIDRVFEARIGYVHVVTGTFKSIVSQPITNQQLIPFVAEDQGTVQNGMAGDGFASDRFTQKATDLSNQPPFTLFEPNLNTLLDLLLSHFLKAQLNQFFLENCACEHAARMTAMDNATRNAREMIQKLQLRYNQGRQAQITNELIEIISGSSAV